MTDLADFDSAGFAADFNSDFLFVTGAFNCTGADFAATLDNGLAAAVFGAGFVVVLATTLGCGFAGFVGALVAAFTGFLAELTALVLLADLATVVFFMAGFAVDLDEVDLAAVGRAFFSVSTKGFAGFFIAFAIKSLPIKVLLSHRKRMLSQHYRQLNRRIDRECIPDSRHSLISSFTRNAANEIP